MWSKHKSEKRNKGAFAEIHFLKIVTDSQEMTLTDFKIWGMFDRYSTQTKEVILWLSGSPRLHLVHSFTLTANTNGGPP